MAIESAYKSSVAVKLNAGESPTTWNMVGRCCSFGKVVQGADKDKIMNVVGALLPVLDHSMVRVERTEVTILEN